MSPLYSEFLVLGLHAPDGFFTMPVLIFGWSIVSLTTFYALRVGRKGLDDRLIPIMGVMAAFIFAAQILNFPVPGGTSAHLIGGALAAIALGPWLAVLVMLAVTFLQALLFQDGGLVSLGVNALNLAVLSPLSGWLVFKTLSRLMRRRSGGIYPATFVAGWVSVMVSSLALTLELSISGTAPLRIVLPAVVITHTLVGLAEGAITASALIFIDRATRFRNYGGSVIRGSK